MSSLSRSNATSVRAKKKLQRNIGGLQLDFGTASPSTPSEAGPPQAISQLRGHAPVDYAPFLNSAAPDMELSPSTVKVVAKLGEGSSGTVCKVRHEPSGIIMARKAVPADPDPAIHRQIIRELSFLKSCHSPHIVSFIGAYFDDNDTSIAMCTEYCQGGSLDAICQKIKAKGSRFGEGILGKVSEAVLEGLVYLHDNRIIHRDVKPSNILVAWDGLIKLCDFGVSGELVDSIAQTFVGTSYYMAPERIQGYGYAVQSDIWSLGLTITELANQRFPFPAPGEPPLAILELLDYIVRMPAPTLSVSRGWSPECCQFVEDCLIKDPKARPSPRAMLDQHPFIKRSQTVQLNLHDWICQVWS
ncbi:Protein kinase C signaling pathway involved MAPKK protein [Entomophthora muscae]|uniref:Protein kinase C signaling pathway involved MAPKK protein n=1 Tax=Entomophthora muscae TaxID=34485 RepID=A0ACC2T7Z5_9FUNG|nr:Protein kinase C signaling pathway involved MAPKK protein [Entomophthora muscae]